MFIYSIFPALFDKAAQEAYVESTDTFTKLFENREKYDSIMKALAKVLFEEMQKSPVTTF